MKITHVINSRLQLIFPEISGKFTTLTTTTITLRYQPDQVHVLTHNKQKYTEYRTLQEAVTWTLTGFTTRTGLLARARTRRTRTRVTYLWARVMTTGQQLATHLHDIHNSLKKRIGWNKSLADIARSRTGRPSPSPVNILPPKLLKTDDRSPKFCTKVRTYVDGPRITETSQQHQMALITFR